MRRSLVLSSEQARHWFRAALPQRRAAFGDLPETALLAGAAGNTPNWLPSRDDVRGAVSVYFATFAAVLAFIA